MKRLSPAGLHVDLLLALLLGSLLLGACGQADTGDSTYVSRSLLSLELNCSSSTPAGQGIQSSCAWDEPDDELRNRHGEVVTMRAGTFVVPLLDLVDEATTNCGGETYIRPQVIRGPEAEAPSARGRVRYIDFATGGSAELRMDVESFMLVRAIGGDFLCSQEEGEWTGTAGALLGESGDYLMTRDILQRELTLKSGG